MPDSNTDPKPITGESLTEYVESQLFSESFDSLKSYLIRKRALAHPVRYSILYRVYEHGAVPYNTLCSEIDIDDEDIFIHLNALVDVNLVARIPAPGDTREKDTYRITALGRQAIDSDRVALTE